jgi:glycerol uptake facilitator-like aquaporin
MAQSTPFADVSAVFFALQCIGALFASFLWWWMRDLVRQFREHDAAADRAMGAMREQIATLMAFQQSMSQSLDELRNEVRELRHALIERR